MRKEFIAVFQITRTILFSVNYYSLGTNQNPYFTSRAYKFYRNKMGYSDVGQCQNRILPKGSVARRFFRKWDKHHLHQLSDKQLDELYADLEELRNTYNYIIKEKDTFQNDNCSFSFDCCKELSMMELKKKKTT